MAEHIYQPVVDGLEKQFEEQLTYWEKNRPELRLLRLPSAWSSAITERKSPLSVHLTLRRWQELVRSDSHLQFSVLGGCPVSHSLSPALHNFFSLGTAASNGLYLCAGWQNEAQLNEVLKNWFKLPLLGANITSPFKECVFKYLSQYGELTPEAKAIGAVNTIYGRRGKLYGANTDWSGWLSSWRCDIGQELAGRQVVLFGAGGAVRAVVYALIRAEVGSITVVNSPRRGRALVDYFSTWQHRELSSKSFVPLHYRSTWEDRAAEPGVIYIQATVLGGGSHAELSPYSWPVQTKTNASSFNFGPTGSKKRDHLNSAVACDLIYHPARTKFLLEAEAAGAVTMNGLGMLICQACQAREYFLEIDHSDAWEEQMLSQFRNYMVGQLLKLQ
ncbi:MAG: shikimate dehydrogenase family protein [Candidatus Bruticola sp.]